VNMKMPSPMPIRPNHRLGEGGGSDVAGVGVGCALTGSLLG
jgi:hypothetical protein